MKRDCWSFIALLSGSLMLIIWGIIMLFNDLVGVGKHYLTQQLTAGGGWLLILLGVIMLFPTYYSLSPYSKIRRFIEDKLEF